MGVSRRSGYPQHIASTAIMAKASEAELNEAFKLYDTDGDGVINHEEILALISKIGGTMSEGEAKALVSKADKDGSKGIDFTEFAMLMDSVCLLESPSSRELTSRRPSPLP